MAVHAIGISAAFLQGEPLKREVFLKPPRDACSAGFVWKLKRCIYGLNDAPRSWYEKVRKTLLALGATVSSFDNCLFMWHKDGILSGVLVSHVDDFAFAGTEIFHKNVIGSLNMSLKIGSYVKDNFQYLGLQFKQSRDAIVIHQSKYIDSIEPILIDPKRVSDDSLELTHDELMNLKRLSGQMNWVVTQTRQMFA